MHIAQIGFIKPVMDHLVQSGSNVDALIHQSGLNKFQYRNQETYVPISYMYQFLNLLESKEGISDFLDIFSHSLELQAISQWGELIVSAPDLYSSCRLVDENDKVMLTNERITFRIQGTSAYIDLAFEDGPVIDREHHENINLALAINGIGLAAGKNFVPKEIHIQQRRVPNLENLIPAGADTRILIGQPSTRVVFDSSHLCNPMLIRDSIPGKSNELPETPDTFARKCTAILNSNTETNLPSMLAMAEMAGVSESSLRRRLAEEETTYFRVVDDWRFSWAIRLIQDPQFTLKEITASLRYANLPNFERAFKRWTGITPGQFRNQL